MNEFLKDFPYDIRRLEKGAPAEVPGPEGTLTIDWEGNHQRPIFSVYGCWSLMGETTVLCLDDPADWDSNNLTKAAELVRKGLDELPNMGYKCVLTYRTAEDRVFDACYLVATSHSDWWEKYPLIHEAGCDSN